MGPSKIIGSSKNGSSATDWLGLTVNGGAMLLTLVSDAARLAPVPYLQQAAGVTVKIVQAMQTVTDNKMAFRRIAKQAMELIASIWEAYQRSPNKASWPPKDIAKIIIDLSDTLQLIFKLVEKQLSRSKAKRFITSMRDGQTITEYRERLQACVNNFEVASHLRIHETLGLVIQAQIDAQEEREHEKIEQAEREREQLQLMREAEEARIRDREESRRAQQEADDMLRFLASEREHRDRMQQEAETQDAIARIHAASDAQTMRAQAAIEEENRRKAAEELEFMERERERRRMAMEDEERLERMRREEEAMAERERVLREQAAEETARAVKAMKDILNAERAEREMLEREASREISQLREQLEQASKAPSSSVQTSIEVNQKVSNQESVLMSAAVGKYKVNVTETSGKRPSNMKARIESEDEDSDETDSDSEYVDESSSSEEYIPPPPPPPPAKKRKSKGKTGIHHPAAQNNPGDILAAAYVQMGLNGGSPPAPGTPPYHPAFHSPNPSSPPPPQQPYSPPHMYGGPSYFGSASVYGVPISPPPPPPPPPPMGGYMSVGGYYGQPGSTGGGNVTNTTISNVGNNYSVNTTYASPKRRKKKSERS